MEIHFQDTGTGNQHRKMPSIPKRGGHLGG